MSLLEKIKENLKDRHLCNIEQLNKKLKQAKFSDNFLFILTTISIIIMAYYLIFEENIILSIIGGVFFLFIFLLFEIIFMISMNNTNNLKLFIYIHNLFKGNNGEKFCTDATLHDFPDAKPYTKCRFCGKTVMEVFDEWIEKNEKMFDEKTERET
jgi:hypothetical protein